MTDYTLYHGDCLDILPTLEAGSVDAVIADIPSGRTACAWDSVIPFDAMWSNLKRLAKRHAPIVLLGCTQPFTSALIASNYEMFRYDWVWNKKLAGNFLNANRLPLLVHESICVFSSAGASNGANPSMLYNPIMTPRDKVRLKPSNVNVERWKNPKYAHLQGRENDIVELGARYPVSIIDIGNTDRRDRIHPTQKPLALLEYLVKTYTNAGDTVLDFTMGSGTTGHACGNLGRRFIGIEKDLNYFNVAQERIATAYEPLRHMMVAS